jgi:SAM-dependent methyltransferase
MPARYDGHADWYEERGIQFTLARTPLLLDLLGEGPGRCLDLGCGVGVHLPAITARGWTVVGTDLSADQLHIAAGRAAGASLVRADAARLPFADRTFDAIVMAFVHTDLDDLAGALAEAARVLAPCGRLVHLGIHPCFIGPFARSRAGEPPQLLPGYRRTAWTRDAPGFGEGLRRRVGSRHVPLAHLLNAVLSAGLALERAEEPGSEDYPGVLALVARR